MPAAIHVLFAVTGYVIAGCLIGRWLFDFRDWEAQEAAAIWFVWPVALLALVLFAICKAPAGVRYVCGGIPMVMKRCLPEKPEPQVPEAKAREDKSKR